MEEKEFYRIAGKRVKELRERQNITQEELSAKTGIDQSIISKFENTGKKISAFRLKQILEAMGCTLGDLATKKKKTWNSPLPFQPITA